jgi:hypothetical protein
MNTKNENWFFNLAAAMLLLTALAKLFSAGGNARVLHAQDQLLHLGYRPLMISAALLEVAVAVFLLKGRSDLRRYLVLLWLSANFISYHLGIYLLGLHTCPCLGQLADRLPLPRGLADIFLQVLVLYWFAASVNSLWRMWGSEQWARLALAPRSVFRRPAANPHRY